ncbi:alpha/beta hydrolase [Streptomyces sp. NBC_00873]|uniref:alpha/beta fold hydrolase n=1 Tax=unclassified Streptomyces TaxID=2593676 RepID=UPI003867946E|nr:alpha/beta hydrolase [Streptomyces sp. NBC_00873]WTA47295.1 alpha/beta hydrolase [Streptomyces sp. NBC_00842]
MLEKRQIVVGGVRSAVRVSDASPDSDEAVVFVHGNPGAGEDWGPLLTRTSAFARVIAPDMPGFGEAERRADQDYTVPSQAAHLGGIVDQLDVERAHLVLHDFGGPWGLTWAAAHPDRVASVTLINTGINRGSHWHGLARLWRTPIAGELTQLLIRPRVNRAILRRKNPALPDEWRDRIVNHAAPTGTKRAVLQMYRSLDLAALEGGLTGPLREMGLPALVVWGADDAFVPAELARRQLKSLPGARVETVPGAGHWPWLEAPEKAAALILPFLREQLGKTSAGREPSATAMDG